MYYNIHKKDFLGLKTSQITSMAGKDVGTAKKPLAMS